MKTLPLRLKFALWAAGLTGLVLAVYSVGTFINLYDEQIEAVDLEIQAEGRRLLARQSEPGGNDASRLVSIFQYQPWLAAAVFSADETLLARSDRLPAALAQMALPGTSPITLQANHRAWRLRHWTTDAGHIIVGYDLDEVSEISRDLLISYALSLPLVLLVAGAGGWWIAGLALRPIRALTTAAENVQAASLDQRVAVPPSRDEISRLADVLNAMFARLETSFGQAQRFAADASHELRTPLTVMRGEVEAMLRQPHLLDPTEAGLLSLQEEIVRLDRITTRLLQLARFDAGRSDPTTETVDLSALAVDCGEDAELVATSQALHLTTEIAPNLSIPGNASQLRTLLVNLLENALRYNHAQGAVHFRVTADQPDGISIRVSNTGPGIPEELRERIFERFFRADPSRSEQRGHGLGLSLCQEIVRAHGGSISLVPNSRPGWTEFRVTLPA